MHQHILKSVVKVLLYAQTAADFDVVALQVAPGRVMKLPVYQAFAFPRWSCGQIVSIQSHAGACQLVTEARQRRA
jgi:hypothetical protein